MKVNMASARAAKKAKPTLKEALFVPFGSHASVRFEPDGYELKGDGWEHVALREPWNKLVLHHQPKEQGNGKLNERMCGPAGFRVFGDAVVTADDGGDVAGLLKWFSKKGAIVESMCDLFRLEMKDTNGRVYKDVTARMEEEKLAEKHPTKWLHYALLALWNMVYESYLPGDQFRRGDSSTVDTYRHVLRGIDPWNTPIGDEFVALVSDEK